MLDLCYTAWNSVSLTVQVTSGASVQTCLPLSEKILSKWCNNVNNWSNPQHYHRCETIIC